MRTFDFAPLYRSTVGFDRMFSLLDQLGGVEGSVPSYPPYNIERNGENAFRISVAVAGFTDADLSIEAKENTLTIRGEKQANDEEKTADVLYKGIAERTFERSFQLADHVVVKGARLENGLLHVDLEREIPEADEASGDPDRELRQSPAGHADQGRCLKFWPVAIWGCSGFSGRFRCTNPLAIAVIVPKYGYGQSKEVQTSHAPHLLHVAQPMKDLQQ